MTYPIPVVSSGVASWVQRCVSIGERQIACLQNLSQKKSGLWKGEFRFVTSPAWRGRTRPKITCRQRPDMTSELASGGLRRTQNLPLMPPCWC